MAKRGRKKKNKVTSLSAADKNHLSRIMKKVRQIKANKAASAPSKAQVVAGLFGDNAAVRNLQQQLVSLSANLAAPGNFQRYLNVQAQLNALLLQLQQQAGGG